MGTCTTRTKIYIYHRYREIVKLQLKKKTIYNKKIANIVRRYGRKVKLQLQKNETFAIKRLGKFYNLDMEEKWICNLKNKKHLQQRVRKK